MSRLLSAMKLDFTIQVRNSLYTIGISVGLLIAVAIWRLADPGQMWAIVPTLMLLVVGASTLLYVAGMILFERDEGTLAATIVSPLTTEQYLGAKLITLTALATLEALVMVGGGMALMSLSKPLDLPNLPLLLLGVIAIGLFYTLVGIILVVRFDKITDFLVPMAGIAVILQIPFLYFLGWIQLPALLLIPTSAPAMLMRGAYIPLAAWEWVYAIGYTGLMLILCSFWARRAFRTHVISRAG